MPYPVDTPQPLTTPNLRFTSVPELLNEVIGLFDNVVYHWNPILFKRRFRQRIKNAWNDVRNNIQQAIADLRNLPPDVLANILDRVGMSGNQLDLKLAVLKDTWNRFNQRGLVVLLKDVLELVNIYVGSLTQAFPLLEPLKEISELIVCMISQNESAIG